MSFHIQQRASDLVKFEDVPATTFSTLEGAKSQANVLLRANEGHHFRVLNELGAEVWSTDYP